MTTTHKPPLRLLLCELREQAARTGEDRGVMLSGGARVAWRVRGGSTTFAVSRKEKQVGSTEIEVFKAQAGVPPTAERLPPEGQQMIGDAQGLTWWRVGWRWSE